jgi:hypothetical protein
VVLILMWKLSPGEVLLVFVIAEDV